jgi:hypothetical protein
MAKVVFGAFSCQGNFKLERLLDLYSTPLRLSSSSFKRWQTCLVFAVTKSPRPKDQSFKLSPSTHCLCHCRQGGTKAAGGRFGGQRWAGPCGGRLEKECLEVLHCCFLVVVIVAWMLEEDGYIERWAVQYQSWWRGNNVGFWVSPRFHTAGRLTGGCLNEIR